MKHIREAMSRTLKVINPQPWYVLLGELVQVGKQKLTDQDEQTLLDILAFEGELQLDETKAMPHRCSPEKMLKERAAKILSQQADPVKYQEAIHKIFGYPGNEQTSQKKGGV